jgi:hypothetical protein
VAVVDHRQPGRLPIIANQGGFTAKPFFEITEAADREVPQVSFSEGQPAEQG